MTRLPLEHSETARVVLQLELESSSVAAIYELAHYAPRGGQSTASLPDDATADAALRQLGVSDQDLVEVLAARPVETTDSAQWWLFERCSAMLISRMGTVGPLPTWPDLPDSLGAPGRYLYVWVFLACLPAAREYHREREIPDELSWEILSVLSAQMNNRRAIYGEGGLHTQNWVTHHFRGAIYSLGRLHFERLVLGFSPDATLTDARAGDWALGLHIPEGRLTPELCDDAIAWASEFFPRHFPEEHYALAVCTSWILDPQIEDYLGEDTNIVQFLRRFTLIPHDGTDGSATAVEFLFKRPVAEKDQLPRDSSLQRGVLEHIEAGKQWFFRTGWFPLKSSDGDLASVRRQATTPAVPQHH